MGENNLEQYWREAESFAEALMPIPRCSLCGSQLIYILSKGQLCCPYHSDEREK